MGTFQAKMFNYFKWVNNDNIQVVQLDPPNMECTITQYGPDSGDLIRGTYTGEVEVLENQMSLGVKQITGEFKVIRE